MPLQSQNFGARPRNAVLRQNVVPTSGWRSCTAVPVELTAADVDVFKGEAWCKYSKWKKHARLFYTPTL